MKTLVCEVQQPLNTIKRSPWKPRSPNLHPTAMKTLYHPKRAWKIYAEAKGFPRGTSKLNEEKGMQKQKQNLNGRPEVEDDDKISDVVMGRMIVRILFNVGVPLVTGIALLQVFQIVKEQHLWDVPRWLPFLTTFVTFGASALGVAFGTLSSSWDPEKKGSLLGFQEAQENWTEMWKQEEEK